MHSSLIRRAEIFALILGLAVPAHAQLNDSGIAFCGVVPSGNTPAPCTPDPAAQDQAFGADAAARAGVLYKTGDGAGGFDFTKIANDGSELPPEAVIGSGPNDWACTRDNVTGLIWEVKTADGGMRDREHHYSWFDSASPDGSSGEVGDRLTCNAALGSENCNTQNFVAAVNAAGLCGISAWKLPSKAQLLSVADLGHPNGGLDPDYFPNAQASLFWTRTVTAGNASNAWTVRMGGGDDNPLIGERPRNDAYRVRLVSGGAW